MLNAGRCYMSQLSSIITALGGLCGAIALVVKAWNLSKETRSKTRSSEFDDATNQLNKIIEQKESDVEFYRKRWLKVEAENEKLKKKLDKE